MTQQVENPPAMWETWVRYLGWNNPLEEGMETHSSTRSWKIPWTEETGRLQPRGSQRVRHNWATKHKHISKLGVCLVPSATDVSRPDASTWYPYLLERCDIYWSAFLPWPHPFLLGWNWRLFFISSKVTPDISLVSNQLCKVVGDVGHCTREMLHRSMSPDRWSLVDGNQNSALESCPGFDQLLGI